MTDPLINVVTKPPMVQDALKKSERNKSKMPPVKKNKPDKKDPKRIIDTYA
ncbi:MAG: hypothetical protein ACI8XX_000362 [Polaribacter sp.]|jgi:hypothetical protein